MAGDALRVAGEQLLEVAVQPCVACVAGEPEGGLGVAAAQRELDVSAQIGGSDGRVNASRSPAASFSRNVGPEIRPTSSRSLRPYIRSRTSSVYRFAASHVLGASGLDNVPRHAQPDLAIGSASAAGNHVVGELHNTRAHEPIIKDHALFERVQRRTVSRGRQAKSERLLARLGVLRCGTCGSRMVINSDSGNYRCGDTSASPCQRRAAVKADRVEEMVLDAVREYCATADVDGGAPRRQQIREADESIERANANLDATIRQLGELGLSGRAASQETLGKLTKAVDDAHTARARLGNEGDSNAIGPDDIAKLRDPAKRRAAWRRLITDTVRSVTVAPAMTADGRPSRLWDPDRIDIRFVGPARA
jgi:hypothetical protein